PILIPFTPTPTSSPSNHEILGSYYVHQQQDQVVVSLIDSGPVITLRIGAILPGDDCGHIIAASLGGKMVDFKLFPQTRFINRGQYGWASVEFEVRLFYDDMEYKDRPSGGKILITFKGDRMKKSGIHNSNQNEQSSSSLYATLKGKLINLIKDES
ncbi:unnamed protein product, partial [Rotaria sp. Silwood1]